MDISTPVLGGSFVSEVGCAGGHPANLSRGFGTRDRRPEHRQVKAIADDLPAGGIFDAEREIASGPHRSVHCVHEDVGRTR